jgi:hypothetical protein
LAGVARADAKGATISSQQQEARRADAAAAVLLPATDRRRWRAPAWVGLDAWAICAGQGGTFAHKAAAFTLVSPMPDNLNFFNFEVARSRIF